MALTVTHPAICQAKRFTFMPGGPGHASRGPDTTGGRALPFARGNGRRHVARTVCTGDIHLPFNRLTEDAIPTLRCLHLKNVKSKSEVDGYIGSRIRECRLSLSLTQEGLANALGISFQPIQNYEKGANGISAVRLFDICKILNVSPLTMFPPRPLQGS